MATQSHNEEFEEKRSKFPIEHYGREYYEKARETFDVLYKDIEPVAGISVNWSPGVVRVRLENGYLDTERLLVDSLMKNIGGSLNDVSESPYSGWEVRSYYIGDNVLEDALIEL